MNVLASAAVSRKEVRASVLTDVALVVAGSVLLAAAAQIAIRLPGNPVPVTGQTLGVLLVGACLGARRGTAAVLLYLAYGAAGLPVFAGASGGLALLSTSAATGGYLVGFVPAAFVVGALAERKWDRRPLTALPAMVLGEVVIFAVGVTWLAGALNVSVGAAVGLGLTPFLLGEGLKLAVATGLLPGAWAFLRFQRR